MNNSDNLLTNKPFLGLLSSEFFNVFFDVSLCIYCTNLLLSYNVHGYTGYSLFLMTIALYILPILFFSSMFGLLSDKYDKSLLIKISQHVGIISALMATAGLLGKNAHLLLIAVVIAGLKSSVSLSCKQSAIPSLVKKRELSLSNSLMQSMFFFAVMAAFTMGGMRCLSVSTQTPFFSVYGAIAILIGTSVLSAVSSYLIMPVKSFNPEMNISSELLVSSLKNIFLIGKTTDLILCVLGISWFFFLITSVFFQIPLLVRATLYAESPYLALFEYTLIAGILSGTIWCGVSLSKREISSRLAPISALFTTIFLTALTLVAILSPGETISLKFISVVYFRAALLMVLLFCFGVSAGVFIVPHYSMLQHFAGVKTRGRVISANVIINILSAVFSFMMVFMLTKTFNVYISFLMLVLLAVIEAFVTCMLLPEHIVRIFLRRLLDYMYGVKVNGVENLYKPRGNCLVVANHTSFLDGVLLWVYIPYRFSYAIDKFQAENLLFKPILSFVKYYTVNPSNPMSVKSIIDEVKKGHRIVIFPEGRITTTGALMKIYPGPAVIADKANAEILPISIEGSQYSIFSRFGSKLKTRLHSKIILTVQPPVRLNIPEQIQGHKRRNLAVSRLYDIMCNMKYKAAPIDQTLFDALIDAQKLVGRKKEVIEDANMTPVNYGKFITVAFALGRQFAKKNAQGSFVGMMLPNSIATAAAFFGMSAFNMVPCMINFSTGIRNILSSCKAARIKRIYTSREFIRKGGLDKVSEGLTEAGIELIYLEDVKKQITKWEQIFALLMSFMPRKYYKQIRGNASPHLPAVVLFTSGSEGVPKGVVLSHRNLQSDRFQLQSALDYGINDVMFNAMPVFHSFGLSAGTILPLLTGMKVFLYPSPLHYRIVPDLIYNTNATMVLGTETFFSGYAKTANPYDFYSVRMMVSGAEKLKEGTVRMYNDIFGVRIFEGYGATETAPVISVNTPMFFRRGSVGRILPGMEYKVEKEEGIKEGGRLFVRGANVMMGYFKEDRPCHLIEPRDGWYDTGDIVKVDEDGFLSVIGRAKRFAKIGGEMISLGAVENVLYEIWKDNMHAVISVPDERKGEQLIMFSTNKNITKNDLVTEFVKRGYSELTVPKEIKYVEELPLMPTGKPDYQVLKTMV